MTAPDKDPLQLAIDARRAAFRALLDAVRPLFKTDPEMRNRIVSAAIDLQGCATAEGMAEIRAEWNESKEIG